MLRPLNSIRGFKLAASDGEIGKVREVYFDDYRWIVRYFVVETGGWLTGRDVLVAPRSLGKIDEENETIAVHLTQEQIRHSPPIESKQPVSRQYEEAYHAYYGWERGPWAAPGGAPAFWAAAPTAVLRPEAFEPPDSAEATEAPKVDPHLRSSSEVSGYAIHAQDGHIGHLEEFVIDDEEWKVRYLIIDTRNWLPGKRVLISPDWIKEISFIRREVFVNATRDQIKDAPEYDPDQPVSRALERKLYEFYGYKAYWEGIHAARLHC